MPAMKLLRSLLSFLCLSLPPAAAAAEIRREPFAASDSLARMRIADGFAVDLVASEPEVADPVALAFDERGRMWVVEMPDYPSGPAAGSGPGGRITILEDPRGEGRYRRASVFAEGLLFATGVTPWKGGVFATTRDEVLYLADADGDGRADGRRVICSGFKETNSQLLPNHPTWSADNQIWVANGLRATDLQIGGAPAVAIGGRDFRFDPRSGRVEAVSGMSQFGLAFDDWGRRFICENRHHLRHVVMPRRALERSPRLALESPVDEVPDHGAAARIFPLTRNWTTSNLHTGTFTAACGVFLYRGDLLESLRGDAFVCEPPGGLVHRDRLRFTGSTFVAARVGENAEFLASSDDWFRPVNLTLGPEGAIYLADMYRAVIEHPQWMPPEEKDRPDLLLGKGLGRIYRIVPRGGIPAGRAPAPPPLRSVEEKVGALAHPSGFWRDTAQRLLVEEQPAAAAPLLERLAREGPSPLARFHALRTLEGLGKLGTELLAGALDDRDPQVRRDALALAEPRLAGETALRPSALRLARDPDRGVRFQAALSLGELPEKEGALPALAELSSREGGDRWFRAAILTSAGRHPGRLLGGIFAKRQPPEGLLQLLEELGRLSSYDEPDEQAAALATMAKESPSAADGEFERAELAVIAGLHSGSPEAMVFRERLPAGPAREELAAVRSLAARVIADGSRPRSDRRRALLVFSGEGPPAVGLLQSVAASDRDPEIRLVAVRSLGRQQGNVAAIALLDGLGNYTPALRREAIDALLASAERANLLLARIEEGRLAAQEIEPAQRSVLLQHPDPGVRARANKAIAAALPDRGQVLREYRGALSLAADLGRGRQVFEKVCSGCHAVAGLGVDVGPDISDTRERSAEALLVDILDPNRAIDGNYAGYTLVTRDRRILTGVLSAETSSAVTLKSAGGRSETVAREDLESLSATGLSPMPEGLERDLTVQDAADLLRFLKGWRYDG